jgi:hypothetical protein
MTRVCLLYLIFYPPHQLTPFCYESGFTSKGSRLSFEVQKEGFEVVLRLSFEFQVDGLTTQV